MKKTSKKQINKKEFQISFVQDSDRKENS